MGNIKWSRFGRKAVRAIVATAMKSHWMQAQHYVKIVEHLT